MKETTTLYEKIKLAISGKKTFLFSILAVLLVGLTLTAFAAKQRHSYSHLNSTSNSGSWNLLADNDDRRGYYDDDDDDDHRRGYYDDDDDDDHRRGYYDDDDDYDDDDRYERRRGKSSKSSNRKAGRQSIESRDYGGIKSLMLDGNSLAEYDLDENGVLSLKERQAAQADQFKKLDANNNRRVEESEFLNFFAKMVEKRMRANFVLMDTNEDNLLTKSEFDEFSRQRRQNRTSFSTTDANANGEVSLKEYVATYLNSAKRQSKAAFIILDDNDDKALSQEEFKSFSSYRGKRSF